MEITGLRKVIAVEMVSLDGFMEAPETWTFSYADDEMLELVDFRIFGTGVVSLAYRLEGQS